jgi:hypothetical protein
MRDVGVRTGMFVAGDDELRLSKRRVQFGGDVVVRIEILLGGVTTGCVCFAIYDVLAAKVYIVK